MKLHRCVANAEAADITWGHVRRVLNVVEAAETLFKRLFVLRSDDNIYISFPTRLAIRYTLQDLAGILDVSLFLALCVMMTQSTAVIRAAERAIFLQLKARRFLLELSCFPRRFLLELSCFPQQICQGVLILCCCCS